MTITTTATTSATTATLTRVVHDTVAALTQHPQTGVITPAARTHLIPDTATGVDVTTSTHRFIIDEPAALGGDNEGANPVEHLLAALAACQVITYRVWAAKLGIAVDTVEVDADGDLDIRGFFGVDDSVAPGFSGIRTTVRITGPESAERYRELTRWVETHCPVLDTLTRTVPVATTLEIAEG